MPPKKLPVPDLRPETYQDLSLATASGPLSDADAERVLSQWSSASPNSGASLPQLFRCYRAADLLALATSVQILLNAPGGPAPEADPAAPLLRRLNAGVDSPDRAALSSFLTEPVPEEAREDTLGAPCGDMQHPAEDEQSVLSRRAA
jgi:hypothetical protein